MLLPHTNNFILPLILLELISWVALMDRLVPRHGKISFRVTNPLFQLGLPLVPNPGTCKELMITSPHKHLHEEGNHFNIVVLLLISLHLEKRPVPALTGLRGYKAYFLIPETPLPAKILSFSPLLISEAKING